jgi:hypothetical protein
VLESVNERVSALSVVTLTPCDESVGAVAYLRRQLLHYQGSDEHKNADAEFECEVPETRARAALFGFRLEMLREFIFIVEANTYKILGKTR